uniref:Uncharacterized protein n=1 Tax=Sipha flava TaxID=143950 RepID=A0A2S2QLY0_9HEMI
MANCHQRIRLGEFYLLLEFHDETKCYERVCVLRFLQIRQKDREMIFFLRFCFGATTLCVSLYVVIIVWIERSPTPNTSDICFRIYLTDMLGSFIVILLYIFTIRILTSPLIALNKNILKK